MPATAELIATIAQLDQGAVVLPGLDIDLDGESWVLIEGRQDATARVSAAVEHPQFAMQALLRRIGITREQVVALGSPAAHGRERYVSEALRPAAVTERWQQFAAGDAPWIERALETLAVVEAANAEEEALAIAISLREALETPHKTAALVTPDRALARRVLAALERRNVAVDDSGGDALADTSAGLFARLTANAALGGLAPVALLALLEASARAARRRGRGARGRGCRAGKGGVAWPAAAAGHGRPRRRTRGVPRRACEAPAGGIVRFEPPDPRAGLSEGSLMPPPGSSRG